MADIFVGDAGTVIDITVKENGVAKDISNATTKEFRLRRPDGSVLKKTVAFKTDGTNGILTYTSIATDFNERAGYTWQVFYITPSGSWHTTRVKFNVEWNL